MFSNSSIPGDLADRSVVARRRRSKKRYHDALCPFLLLLFCLLAVELQAEETKPVVHTSFTVTAPDFVENLGASRAVVEREFAEHLARKAGEHFKFLHWHGVHATGEPTAEPAARIEVRLFIADHGDVLFGYSAHVGETFLETPELPIRELYPVYVDQPTHDPHQLKLDLRGVMEKDFTNGSFRRKLEEQILRYIPLRAGVEPDATAQSIILTVPWADLHATTESELRVEFKAPRPALQKVDSTAVAVERLAGKSREQPTTVPELTLAVADQAAHDGTMHLAPSGATEDPRWPGATQCTIDRLNFPPLQAPWDDRLPEVLHRDKVREMSVYMHHYILDPRAGMSDGVDSTI